MDIEEGGVGCGREGGAVVGKKKAWDIDVV
jgi:hypothetical protein